MQTWKTSFSTLSVCISISVRLSYCDTFLCFTFHHVQIMYYRHLKNKKKFWILSCCCYCGSAVITSYGLLILLFPHLLNSVFSVLCSQNSAGTKSCKDKTGAPGGFTDSIYFVQDSGLMTTLGLDPGNLSVFTKSPLPCQLPFVNW